MAPRMPTQIRMVQHTAVLGRQLLHSYEASGSSSVIVHVPDGIESEFAKLPAATCSEISYKSTSSVRMTSSPTPVTSRFGCRNKGTPGADSPRHWS